MKKNFIQIEASNNISGLHVSTTVLNMNMVKSFHDISNVKLTNDHGDNILTEIVLKDNSSIYTETDIVYIINCLEEKDVDDIYFPQDHV